MDFQAPETRSCGLDRHRTTYPLDRGRKRPSLDLVNRDFSAEGPNQLLAMAIFRRRPEWPGEV